MTTGQIPKSTYNFPDEFDEYVKHQIGIIVGHQGFDNNILLAEAFMKLLPQIELGIKAGYFDNMYSRQKLEEGLNEISSTRIKQIWRIGTFVAITRNHDETLIVNREIIYPLPEKVIVFDKSKPDEIITDLWETITPCESCGSSEKYVQATANDLNDLFPTGVQLCEGCGKQDEIEIEVKPSLKQMELVRPKHSSPIWREIQCEVPMRYAHEDGDLVALASTDGGFYDDFVDGRIPKYTDIKQILNSEETTCFPSKVYYENSMNLIFDEFLFHFNILLIDIQRILVHRKQQFVFESKPNKLREKFRETNEQE